ncbi:hypothetical protein BegalDRAFT_3194 [Beggiatoa alba B18LD]|uniref:Uncharacterized protein n=1 Tax=Beggiatoa alba B18LD TaxID=395493 RepID=I3CK74_9GAMM|nr:hypothetical protein BegalDRAFT_3194 [Beggiatoa alba B18LD]
MATTDKKRSYDPSYEPTEEPNYPKRSYYLLLVMFIYFLIFYVAIPSVMFIKALIK